jgi:hypothetical protein
MSWWRWWLLRLFLWGERRHVDKLKREREAMTSRVIVTVLLIYAAVLWLSGVMQ